MEKVLLESYVRAASPEELAYITEVLNEYRAMMKMANQQSVKATNPFRSKKSRAKAQGLSDRFRARAIIGKQDVSDRLNKFKSDNAEGQSGQAPVPGGRGQARRPGQGQIKVDNTLSRQPRRKGGGSFSDATLERRAKMKAAAMKRAAADPAEAGTRPGKSGYQKPAAHEMGGDEPKRSNPNLKPWSEKEAGGGMSKRDRFNTIIGGLKSKRSAAASKATGTTTVTTPKMKALGTSSALEGEIIPAPPKKKLEAPRKHRQTIDHEDVNKKGALALPPPPKSELGKAKGKLALPAPKGTGAPENRQKKKLKPLVQPNLPFGNKGLQQKPEPDRAGMGNKLARLASGPRKWGPMGGPAGPKNPRQHAPHNYGTPPKKKKSNLKQGTLFGDHKSFDNFADSIFEVKKKNEINPVAVLARARLGGVVDKPLTHKEKKALQAHYKENPHHLHHDAGLHGSEHVGEHVYGDN